MPATSHLNMGILISDEERKLRLARSCRVCRLARADPSDRRPRPGQREGDDRRRRASARRARRGDPGLARAEPRRCGSLAGRADGHDPPPPRGYAAIESAPADRYGNYGRDDAVNAKRGDRDVKVILPAAATLRGVVTLGGEPVPRDALGVSARRSGAAFATPKIVTRADGAFERPGLTPGTYAVVIAGDDFETKTIAKVELVAGEITDLGTIELDAGRTLRGPHQRGRTVRPRRGHHGAERSDEDGRRQGRRRTLAAAPAARRRRRPHDHTVADRRDRGQRGRQRR